MIKILQIMIIIIQKNLNKICKKIINNDNLRYAFIFPLILNHLNVSIPKDAEPIINYAFGIFIVSLVCVICFINIIFYFIGYYSLNKYKQDIENKIVSYPIIKRIVNRTIKIYEKTSITFIIIEGLMCFIFLMFLVLSSLFIIGIPFFK